MSQKKVEDENKALMGQMKKEAIDDAKQYAKESAVHSASYIPGVEEGAKDLGKKIINSPKGEKEK